MKVRITILLFLFSCFVAEMVGTTRGAAIQESELPPVYVPSGRQLYKEYCAACHASDGKGHGPVARSLRKTPSDLTTLAKRHGGMFPEEYVTNVLRFASVVRSDGVFRRERATGPWPFPPEAWQAAQ